MTLFETTWRLQIGISQYSRPNLWPPGGSLLVMMNIPTHGLTSHWSLRCFVVLLLQKAIVSFLCVVIWENAVLNFSLISCCGSTVCLTVSWAYLWSHSWLRNTTARQQGYLFNAKLIWDLGILQKGSCPKGRIDPVLEIIWNCNDLPPRSMIASSSHSPKHIIMVLGPSHKSNLLVGYCTWLETASVW